MDYEWHVRKLLEGQNRVLLQTEVLHNIIINYHYLYIEESQMNYSSLAI